MRILISTCVQYGDVLPPCLALLEKFWPERQYPLDVAVDHSGNPANWCRFLIQSLDAIDDPFILLMLEDYWLNQPVQPQLIEEALGILKADSSVGCVRLVPWPGSTGGDGAFGPIVRHEPYYASLQASIWEKGYLRSIAQLATGGRAADFELEGGPEAARLLPQSVMAATVGRWPWAIQYENAVRTVWVPEARELAELHNIYVNWGYRGFA